MVKGLRGLNKRVAKTTDGDCYLTPPWAVRWLLERWSPFGMVVCDPCACGYGGWSIGRAIVDGDRGYMRRSDDVPTALELYDVEPRGPGVFRADFRELTLPPTKGGRTIVTNPPYNLLPEFVSWALSQSSVVEVVVLTRFGFLCAEQGRRARYLAEYLQPARRLAFELLPEEGRRRVEHNAALVERLAAGEITEDQYRRARLDVHEDPRCLTGYRMSATGVDHGWAVFRPDHSGPAQLVIESAEEDADSIGEDITPW